MTRPRSQLIVIERTPYYHCISRCVRRAYLCGEDEFSGENFDHRKEWVIARLNLLTEVFAIDVAAYAVMDNHYHLVLHINKALSEQWDRDEIIRRWLMLHKGPVLAQRYHRGEALNQAELAMLDQIVAVWRERLSSISCFMARLNEYIAKRANQEDGCKGRFWEGRFVSRGLVDLPALLSCMAYVDLNPIRAGIADTLQHSHFTSIRQRLKEMKRRGQGMASGAKGNEREIRPPVLMAFREDRRADAGRERLPFNLRDYIELVDCSGRAVRHGKGNIASSSLKALEHLALGEQEWLLLSLEVQKRSIGMLRALNILAASESSKSKKVS